MNRSITISALFILLFVNALFSQEQEITQIREAEKYIALDFRAMKNQRDDSLRLMINARILARFGKILNMRASANYPFDSLRSVARVKPDDGKFTIYSWNVQMQDGAHRYFGYLQVKNNDAREVYTLQDQFDSLTGADSLTLDPQHWPGSLYYKVIEVKIANGNKIYTLLGWRGVNNTLTSKVIEILTFDMEGIPKFGLPVFNMPGEYPKTRIIFRFSANETMVLKYEDQIVKSSKKWNQRKRIFEESSFSDRIIVFDQLIPLDPIMEGQFQYYVPSGDLYNGFRFENGSWHYIQGIESRNASR